MNHKNKLMTILLSAVLLLGSLSAPALAADANGAGTESGDSFTVSIATDLPDGTCSPGDTVTATVTLSNTGSGQPFKLYAAQVEVLYDPALLSVEEVRSDGFEAGRQDGKVVLACLSFDLKGFDCAAETTVAVIQFKALAAGDASLTLENVQLTNRDVSLRTIDSMDGALVAVKEDGTGPEPSPDPEPLPPPATSPTPPRQTAPSAPFTEDRAEPITRGEFLQALATLCLKPDVLAEYTTSAIVYTDVELSMDEMPAIAWATKLGLVNGYGNGRFGPQDDITWEQAAVIAGRYLDHLGQKPGEGQSADLSGLSPWAVDHAAIAANYGVLPLPFAAPQSPLDAKSANTLLLALAGLHKGK